MRIRHIDCFSGPGGICTGFRAAGIETVLAIEKVQACADTYQANHRNVPVIVGDIREVTEEQIRQYVDGDVDIITSGMPCETFSTAGATSRAFYDDRQHLYREAIRIANIVNAKMILFENVPGFLSKRTERNGNRLVVDDLYDDLRSDGFNHFVPVILNAADFGVPQVRERFFVLACRYDWTLITPEGTQLNQQVTVKEALYNLPSSVTRSPDEARYLNRDNHYTRLMRDANFWKLDPNDDLTYHFMASVHRPSTIKRLSLINPGEGLSDLFDRFDDEEIARLQAEKVLPRKPYIQRNRRLIGDEPSVTVTSHCLDELVHPEENRALTIREAARLQSFPDLYDFHGGPLVTPHNSGTQDKYEQIGDAVPPLLAYHWGQVITRIFNTNVVGIE